MYRGENESDDPSPSSATGVAMLIDHYPYEDVFARVPELAYRTDPVLQQLDRLLGTTTCTGRSERTSGSAIL